MIPWDKIGEAAVAVLCGSIINVVSYYQHKKRKKDNEKGNDK